MTQRKNELLTKFGAYVLKVRGTVPPLQNVGVRQPHVNKGRAVKCLCQSRARAYVII